MGKFVRGWKRIPGAIRKPLVLMAGSIVITGGILLIPLPGPGWIIIFAGLALLATEFAFAEKLRDLTLSKLKSTIKKVRNKSKTPPEA